MERGELVPDGLVMKMVEERLKQDDGAGGFVFDGFPRTIPQADQLDGFLKSADSESRSWLSFVSIEDALIRRLSGRRTCSVGGGDLQPLRRAAEGRRHLRSGWRRAGAAPRRPPRSGARASARLRPADQAAGGVLPAPRRARCGRCLEGVEEVSGALTEIMRRAEGSNGRL